MKLKNILQENMRRFATKNLVENESGNLKFAKKPQYDNVWNDIANAAQDLADALSQPNMEDLDVVRYAIKQLKKWTNEKKPAPYSVYALVAEAPALLDKMQSGSKNAWSEMRSHWGGIVDAIADEDEDEYVTTFEPHDTINNSSEKVNTDNWQDPYAYGLPFKGDWLFPEDKIKTLKAGDIVTINNGGNNDGRKVKILKAFGNDRYRGEFVK